MKDGENDWDWLSEEFKYNESRAKANMTYIGGYCMDGLAMALHCIWFTKSFRDAINKSASLGGDADTVSAITGQIAGVIYGLKNIPNEWINTIGQWDRKSILKRGHLLFKKHE